MPLSVADLQGTPVPTTLHLAQGDLNLSWYPGRLSSRIMRDLMAFDTVATLPADRADEGVQILEQAASLLCKLVHSWDLLESEPSLGTVGQPVALTPERLSQFGIPILWAILLALVNESRVGEASGTTSKAPSPASTRTGKRATSRR